MDRQFFPHTQFPWNTNITSYISRELLKISFICAMLAFCTSLNLALDHNNIASAQTLTVNKTVAVVNGEMVTMYELQKNSIAEINKRGFTGNTQRDAAGREGILRQTLDNMIMDILIKQEADRLKLSITDTDVDNEVRKLVQRSQLTPDEFERMLMMQGSSMEMLKERLRISVLRQRMIGLMVSRKVAVTKEEIAKYYEEHKSRYILQDTVDISLIVFEPSTNAEDILAKIRNGKISFEEAAKKYSVEPTAEKGGRLGALPWKDVNPSWKEVLGSMKPGAVSDVFEIERLKAILKLNSAVGNSYRSVEEVTPEIEAELRQPKTEERFKDYTDSLKSKAVIDIRL